MAQYNGNDAYLSIDGTVMTSWFINVELTPSMESVETTAGSSTTHVERAEGLKDTSISLQIGYDAASASTQLPLVEVGTHTVIYGPEGSTAGKPKHEQSFIFEKAGHAVNVKKTHVIFAIDGVGAATPTTDMFSGGVWS